MNGGASDNIIVGTYGGAVDLYYNNVKTFETINKGIQIGDGTNLTLMTMDGVDLKIRNFMAGGNVWLQGRTTGGEIRTMAALTPDGSSALYYDNKQAMQTTSAGFAVNDTDGNDPTLSFKNDVGANLGFIRFLNDDNFDVYDDINDNYIIRATGEAETALYHNGVKVIETSAVGMLIGDGTAAGTFMYYYNSLDFYIDNLQAGGLLVLQSEYAAGGPSTILSGNPDGAVELYYAGVKTFETVVSGVEIPVDNFMYFGDTTTSGSWRTGVSGEDFVHQKYNGSDWETKQTVVG